jgi:hypothetical protein
LNLVKSQDTRILKFKVQVEAELEADKWERVARMTEDDGGKVMTAKEVRLRFKEIQNSGLQSSGANSDDEMPEVTEAGLDSIDRELVGVGEANGSSDLSELEQSDVGESRNFQPEIDEAGNEDEELTQAAQNSIESVGGASGVVDVELDSEYRFTEAVTAEGGSLVSEGSLKRGHKDGDESNGSGSEVEEGG